MKYRHLLYERDTLNKGTSLITNFLFIVYRTNRMKMDEIDDSFESDYDKSTYEQGPKLLLCDYCQQEHLLPSYK
jgi:hypothetical protein